MRTNPRKWRNVLYVSRGQHSCYVYIKTMPKKPEFNSGFFYFRTFFYVCNQYNQIVKPIELRAPGATHANFVHYAAVIVDAGNFIFDKFDACVKTILSFGEAKARSQGLLVPGMEFTTACPLGRSKFWSI